MQTGTYFGDRAHSVDGIYFLRVLSGLVLCILPISTVLYIPLVRVGDTGTVTFNDIWLVLIWGLTGALVLAKKGLTRRDMRGLCISLLAILPCWLGVIGALTYNPSSHLRAQFFVQFKYFGEASIVVTSLLLCSEVQKRRVAKCAVLAGAILILVPVTPMAAWLPRPDTVNLFEGRYMGTIFNPNDFAAITVLILCITFGSIQGRFAWLWKALGVAIASIGVVSSGSRAALVGLFVVVLWATVRNRVPITRKAVVIAVLAVSVGVSLATISSYRERIDSAFASKTVDQNFAARLDAQFITTAAALHHPLGVGFVNFPSATQEFNSTSFFETVDLVYTSDSLYCDYFLASGLVGLIAVLLCFTNAWLLVSDTSDKSERIYLQSGVLAIATIALSSLTPATAFSSPFFFILIGMSSARRDAYMAGSESNNGRRSFAVERVQPTNGDSWTARRAWKGWSANASQ